MALKFWLATRQMRHVAAHRNAVPAAFAATVTLAAHQKAADYTLAQLALRLGHTGFRHGGVVASWTLLGGLDALNTALRDAVQPRWGGMAYQLSLLTGFVLIGGLLDAATGVVQHVPYRTALRLQPHDAAPVPDRPAKGLVVGALIGLPMAALVLWIMASAGAWWWLWAWLAWVAFNC